MLEKTGERCPALLRIMHCMNHSPSPPTAKQAFFAGVRAESPLLVGVFPFGMIYGALALNAGMDVYQAQAMSSVVFAGSAQMVTTQLLNLSMGGFIIVLTIFVVNLRHALYSASVAPYIKHLPTRWKVALAYLLTDEAYAAAITEYEQHGVRPNSHWFFLGAGIALWSIWQISTALGLALGAIIPPEWGLDFTLALTFIAMVVPALKDRPATVAALVAALTALLAFSLPYKLGLILAGMVGIAVGFMLEARQ
jgi:4-azaleucine resistance transporter AzlC